MIRIHNKYEFSYFFYNDKKLPGRISCRALCTEAIISRSTQYAYYYAKKVLQSRWPVAEKIILSGIWRFHYTHFFMQGMSEK